MPRANAVPSGSMTSTTSPRANDLRSTSTTPAGSRLFGRSVSARRAPSSTWIEPATSAAKAIHSLRADSSRSWAANVVPISSSETAPATIPGRSARPITHRIPDHDAIRAAVSLLAIPPLPRPLPPGPAEMASSGSSAATRGISVGVGVTARVGGVEAVHVGQQHEHVGAHAVGDERGDPVVVAVTDLVVGDGVVLVDDRHDAEFEQPGRALREVEVLRRSTKS